MLTCRPLNSDVLNSESLNLLNFDLLVLAAGAQILGQIQDNPCMYRNEALHCT